MTAATTSAVRLNAATITQYLASQPSASLTPGKPRAVLLRAAPVWDGPAEIPWGDGRHTRIAVGPSPLAVYELVLAHQTADATGPEVLVVLTDREEAELGPDLLSKVHRQRVSAVNIWDVVREAFGADATDHWLSEENWAAEALLDATPPGGWPQLSAGTLSRRDALAALAMRRLGIGRYEPDRPSGDTAGAAGLDVHTLLRWSLRPGGPDRYLSLRAPERAGLARFLGEDDRVGLTGRALLALADAEHGPDAVAFGLVCGALWRDTEVPDAAGGRRARGRRRTADGSASGTSDGAAVDAEDYRARGRAERWFGDEPPAHGEALDLLMASFGRACEEFVSALLLSGRSEFDESAATARRMSGAALDRADSLVRQFGAERAARSSPVLAAGLEARFGAVGQALQCGDPVSIARAVEALGEHRLAAGTDARTRIARARMAQRLAQWLAGDPPTASENVAAAIDRQIAETGWADLALEHIEAGGESEPVLRSAYDTLCTSARARRRDIDQLFTQALATWTADGGAPGTMLTVETFLPRVIAPVVKSGERRVLLLVLDGMSAAIAAELGEELREHWAEYDPLADAKDAAHRRAMAAALPTLTAVSRTSLFAAALTSGTQADEKRAFPAHRFWGDAQAAVFHKDDLRAEAAGAPFGSQLLTALSDDRTHVAVVLNTIDDRLAKEQKLGDGTWRLAEIGQLRELLRHAALQGRAVILTSDHGHVVDRHGSRVEAGAPLSARHREPGGPLTEPEVLLAGRRVVVPKSGATGSGEVVALWDAGSRYTAQKAGYHGGASLAEVAIPVLAFLPFGARPPKGWRELGDQRPAWWHLDAPATPTVSAASQPPVQGTSRSTGPDSTGGAQATAGQAAEAVRIVAGRDSLFDMLVPSEEDGSLLSAAAAPDETAPANDALMSALLASEIYQAQVEVLARKRELPRMEQAVRVLLDVGGTLPMTALAQRVGLPASRSAEGFCAVLRQLLNYDGAQVLETLPDGRTLRLNTGLLRSQFELS